MCLGGLAADVMIGLSSKMTKLMILTALLQRLYLSGGGHGVPGSGSHWMGSTSSSEGWAPIW
eukprot:11042091-Ditylum_brightwellii.AAC.2